MMTSELNKRVSMIRVTEDENGMRLDRWFKSHFPGLGFGALQRLVRTGQIRVDGGRSKSANRLRVGQTIRVPPLDSPIPLTPRTIRDRGDSDVLESMILHEDDSTYVFNKPSGLAVQGGSGITRSVDSMLESFRDKRGTKPRLVHRLDRDTSGVLVVARTRSAAIFLTREFRERSTEKTYWALVSGTPSPNRPASDGTTKLSSWLVRERVGGEDRMRVCRHGEPDSVHAVTRYRVVDSFNKQVSWVELNPVTGRTHQLRVQMSDLGHFVIGDEKYGGDCSISGIQNKLHLHARRIRIKHPANSGILDVSASLPPHMLQSWNFLDFYDDEESADV